MGNLKAISRPALMVSGLLLVPTFGGTACSEREARDIVAAWTSPVSLQAVPGPAELRDAAADAGGNVFVTWRQNIGVLPDAWAARYVVGMGWQPAELLETSAVGVDQGPLVAADATGNAMAVWSNNNGEVQAIRFVSGVGWDPAPTVVDSGGSPGNIAVDMDALGNAVIAWERGAPGPFWNVVAARFTPGGGWGGPMLLETDDLGHASLPQVGLDATGNGLVVWSQQDGAGGVDILSNRFTPGGGWSGVLAVESLPGEGIQPALAMNAGGEAIVAWQHMDGSAMLLTNRFTPAGGWESPFALPGEGFNFIMSWPPSIVVAMDDAGTGVLTRLHTNAGGDWYRFENGAGWAGPFRVDPWIYGNIPIGMSPAGHVFLAYTRPSGFGGFSGPYDVRARRHLEEPHPGLGPYEIVSDRQAQSIKVCVDSAGMATIVMSLNVGGVDTRIFASRSK